MLVSSSRGCETLSASANEQLITVNQGKEQYDEQRLIEDAREGRGHQGGDEKRAGCCQL